MGGQESKNLKSTKIELNFWNGGNGDVGHVSLYLPDNFLYISFWPKGRAKGAKSVPSATKDYSDDKREFGRDADSVLKITIDLDCSAMEKKWEEARSKNYSFLGNNCSDAVFTVLEAGNDDFLLAYEAFPRDGSPDSSWSNKDKIVYVRYTLANFRLKGVQNVSFR